MQQFCCIKLEPQNLGVTSDEQENIEETKAKLLDISEYQRSVLEDCLNLRNKCGHPRKYKIGEKKVSSFIEDLVGIVFK